MEQGTSNYFNSSTLQVFNTNVHACWHTGYYQSSQLYYHSHTWKGLTSQQLEDLDCHVILGNTYHLGQRPGPEIMEQMGGLHKFMNWKRGLLTDSGGFQMVSLLKLANITEVSRLFSSYFLIWCRKECASFLHMMGARWCWLQNSPCKFRTK